MSNTLIARQNDLFIRVASDWRHNSSSRSGAARQSADPIRVPRIRENYHRSAPGP